MLGKRDGSHNTFRESRRSDGRAASADKHEDSTFFFSVTGSSPQGEEQSLYTCRLLVGKLNVLGGRWGEPWLVDGGVVDCQAVDTDNPQQVLRVQVVRAITDQSLWRRLNTKGVTQQSRADVSSLAADLENTIRQKASRIASTARAGLILALDATLLPAIAFDGVIQDFQRHNRAWADSLGFEAIWLVGPVSDLVQRLDRTNSGNALDAG